MSRKRPEVRYPDILGGKVENAEIIDLSAVDAGGYIEITDAEGLYVGTEGNVEVTLKDMDDGDSIVFTALQAGAVHPFRIKRIWKDGTTADDIVVVY